MLTPYYPGGYRHDDDPGEPTTGEPRVSITDEEAALLTAYAAGRTVLEIGTGLGVSTRALASSALKVTTVDVDQWVHATIWPTLPDNVECLTTLYAELRFDLVFIDGDHSPEAVRRDVALAESLLTVGGVIVAHDTAFDHVRGALGPGDWKHHPTRYGLSVRGTQ